MMDWRDYEMIPQPRSVYQKIFNSPRRYIIRKAGYRGGVDGGILHRLPNLTRAEALHWLLHDPHGRALLRDSGADVDELADHLCEASNKQKREANMNSIATLRKISALGEHHFAGVIQKHADSVRLPGETSAQAFARVFTADTEEGRAIRTLYQVAKQGSVYDRAMDRAPLTPDEAQDEGEEVVDDALDDERDPMELLERLAAALRARDSKLTKQQAFAKVYTDPANAHLVRRERTRSLAKLYR
jgi:hypothetical protein